MTSVVIDASALHAFLFNEPGSALVAARLPDAVLSAVNYSEVLTKAVERGQPFDGAVAQIRRLQINLIPFDGEQAAIAASLRASTRDLGLGLGDRACLALGLTQRLPVLTADKCWQELDIGVTVELIR